MAAVTPSATNWQTSVDPRMVQAVFGHRSMAASLHYSAGADRRRAASAAVELLEKRPRK
jgi:hypothetical protein